MTPFDSFVAWCRKGRYGALLKSAAAYTILGMPAYAHIAQDGKVTLVTEIPPGSRTWLVRPTRRRYELFVGFTPAGDGIVQVPHFITGAKAIKRDSRAESALEAMADALWRAQSKKLTETAETACCVARIARVRG